MKTDTQLQQDVIAELDWEPAIHAAQIGVQVKDGVVTLTGEVGSYVEKWNAERAAQRVNGVKAMAIDMQVKLSALGKRTDADIDLMGVTGVSNEISVAPSVKASAVKSDIDEALKRTSIADAKKISVEVQGADITLTGTVRNWAEREIATHSAWGTPGVRNVVDNMKLTQ